MIDRERFPRPKPCGECVNPGAVAALARLGMLDVVLERGPAALAGWRIRTGGGREGTGSFDPGSGGGFGISRAALDDALLRCAIARGVRFEEGVRVMDVAPATPRGGADVAPRLATRKNGAHSRSRTARVVVGADGLRSVVARRLGMAGRAPRLRKISLTCRIRGSGPGRTYGLLHLAEGVTVGLAPVEGGEDLWNGTVVVNGAEGRGIAGDAEGFFLRKFAEAGVEWDGAGFELLDGPRASGPFDRPARRAAGDGVLLVGDAAGYYDPLTGQGIYRALRSAELAAPAIDNALRRGRVSGAEFVGYERSLARAFGPGRRVQRLIERVVSRRGPQEAALGRIVSVEGALSRLIAVTGDAAPARSLLEPSLWLRLAGAGSGPATPAEAEE
jgi:menaquinone-9 beta-reductase